MIERTFMEPVQLSEHLYSFADSCNVYLLIDGEAGLLIDAGSGRVVEEVGSLGIRSIEWVLHTHHHRDQCWGTRRLKDGGARVAVPEYERHLFDSAEVYWQTRRVFDNYDNRSTFYTIGENIQVDAILEDYEEFAWRDYRFYVLPAKGHTFGSVALITKIDGLTIAFTGDLMSAGGKLHQLHAMEYSYGSLEGLLFTQQSLRAVGRHGIQLALPSHGTPIINPAEDIDRLERRIKECISLGRGMRVGGEFAGPEPYFLPQFELFPITRHLLWGGEDTCSNFYVILSASGKALFVDYGHAFLAHLHIFADHEGSETARFVEHRLDELFERFDVQDISVVIPTHIHDDHTCGIPYLQRHRGTECWALDEVATVLERPADWASTPCMFPKEIRIDRRFADGEQFSWEEFDFKIYHAPGQTEFHSLLSVEIDGQKVAFTGDNYFVHDVVCDGKVESSPYQTTVMRNSFQLAMHRRCAEVMQAIAPELICPGHGPLLPSSERDIDDYCDFIARKEVAFRNLVDEPADHYVDVFWARLLPYVVVAQPGEEIEYRLLLRNNFARRVTFAARLLAPRVWSPSSSEFQRLELDPGARGVLDLSIVAGHHVDGVRRLVTAEITVDGLPHGPVSEALVTVVNDRDQ